MIFFFQSLNVYQKASEFHWKVKLCKKWNDWRQFTKVNANSSTNIACLSFEQFSSIFQVFSCFVHFQWFSWHFIVRMWIEAKERKFFLLDCHYCQGIESRWWLWWMRHKKIIKWWWKCEKKSLKLENVKV